MLSATLKSGLLVALLSTMSITASPVLAGGLVSEIRGGVLAHDVPDLWSGFRRETTSPDVNLELLLSPSALFFGGTLRPAIGASINTGGDTSHVYADARWQYDLPAGLFVSLGLGGAIHDGNLGPEDPDRKALGSRLLFHMPLEVGYHFDEHNLVSVYFEHTSNAYTQDFNEGLDRLGIRYGYHF